MSVKIYNGYRTKKNYNLRELEEKTSNLKKKIQEQANLEYKQIVVDNLYFLYDNYKLFPDSFKERYQRITNCDFDFDSDFNEKLFIFNVMNGIAIKIENANKEKSIKYPINYHIYADLQIIPVEDAILILWYGESTTLKKVFESQDWIEEYHYQNQFDKPDHLTEKEWEKRRSVWEEGLPTSIPSDRGFTIHLVNTYKFPIYLETLDGIQIPTKEIRSYNLAKHHCVFPEFDGSNYDVLWSESGKQFYKDEAKKLEAKLETISFVN